MVAAGVEGECRVFSAVLSCPVCLLQVDDLDGRLLKDKIESSPPSKTQYTKLPRYIRLSTGVWLTDVPRLRLDLDLEP